MENDLKKSLRQIKISFQNPYRINKSNGTLEIENV
jgi:hypothetical protein